MFPSIIAREWLLGGAVAAVLLPIGCTAPPRVTAAAPIAPGMARIWFYRDYEPSVSRNLAGVALNGTPAGWVDFSGSAIYRDVTPGHYNITVASYGEDINQVKDADLAPGQEVFAKVLAAEWVSGGDMFELHRDTFYVSLVPAQLARAELSTRVITQ